MTLPPKAISALVNIRKNLLSNAAPELAPKVETKPPKVPTMRRARCRGEAWQRYKRSGGN